MHIKRLQIQNFRNFANFDVDLWESVVIVGENNAGKTNLLHALRLVLDPTLPNSARYLELTDFWEGLDDPYSGYQIKISVTFGGFEPQGVEVAAVPQCFDESTTTSTITYVYGPSLNRVTSEQDKYTEEDYEWYFWCENTASIIRDFSFQKFIPLEVLPALRNVNADLESVQRSPLNRLIRRLQVDEAQLKALNDQVQQLMSDVRRVPPIPRLQEDIANRFSRMVRRSDRVNPTLGILSSDPNGLLRYLRLFEDERTIRYISDIGTGYANIVYIVLLLLDLKQREENHPDEERRVTSIIAVEEPEAHLHPHLQRLVYHDLLHEAAGKLPIFLTTHSPHIASVAPLRSLLVLKRGGKGTVGTNILKSGLSENEIQDIQRYLDVTRAELVFSSRVILVEGIADAYILTAFAQQLNQPLDVLGISIVIVEGTHFEPFLKLLGKNALDIPVAIITDGDPQPSESNQLSGLERGVKLLECADSLIQTSTDENLLHQQLQGHGIFVGSHTLEIDLLESGYQKEVLEVFQELEAGPQTIRNLEIDLANWEKLSPAEKKTKIIGRIERLGGKALFTRRLMSKLSTERVPPYIKGALEFMGIRFDDNLNATD